jgi:GTPase involved in cell partitioning and DNA repair
MKKLALLLTCSCILLLISCSDEKTDTLNDLEAITEELTTKSADYTQEDWDIAENQFGLICEKLDQYEFTDEQLKHIGKLKGQCVAIITRKKTSVIKNSLHRLGQEAEGFIYGLKDGLKNEEDH